MIIVEVRSAIFSRFECGKRPPQPSARKPLEPVSKVPTSILDSDGPLSETGSGRSAAAVGTAVHAPKATFARARGSIGQGKQSFDHLTTEPPPKQINGAGPRPDQNVYHAAASAIVAP